MLPLCLDEGLGQNHWHSLCPCVPVFGDDAVEGQFPAGCSGGGHLLYTQLDVDVHCDICRCTIKNG